MGQPRHRAFLRAMQDPELRRIVEKYELTLYQDTRKKELYKLKEEMFFTVDEKTHDADLMGKSAGKSSPRPSGRFRAAGSGNRLRGKWTKILA